MRYECVRDEQSQIVKYCMYIDEIDVDALQFVSIGDEVYVPLHVIKRAVQRVSAQVGYPDAEMERMATVPSYDHQSFDEWVKRRLAAEIATHMLDRIEEAVDAE